MRITLLDLPRPINLLRDALDLSARRGRGPPDGRELVQGPDVQPDLLPQVLLVGDEVDRRPLGQVHDGRQGQHAREEVRVARDRHRVVRHHLADPAGRCDDVPRVQVEVVAARDVAVRGAGCHVARG